MIGLPIMICGQVWNVVAFYCEHARNSVLCPHASVLCKPTGGFLDTSYQYDSSMVGVVIGGIVIFVLAFGLTYLFSSSKVTRSSLTGTRILYGTNQSSSRLRSGPSVLQLPPPALGWVSPLWKGPHVHD
jgi:hypothetical protein